MMRWGSQLAVLVAALALAGCGADTGARPAVEVKVVERVVEVPKPCPVKRPARPAKLARPLPADSIATLALVTAKLLEYDGPGGFADRALAALETCTKPTP